ncbi:hypothetical protein KSP40_PGU015504 [Platanthera guangdongensis]|uniref:PB1 domain-containing protein n=1 Tax=Platanthera guangdongensis TaxID=2320717 RepID=A0ABR2MLJ8_9ASPA
MEEADPSSPNTRLKFLCSYGGRILPRPSDGHLRYVGGETRVLTLPRPITFTDLKEKIAVMFNSELVVKYQLLQEDLDALVSVRNEEDFCYMMDEYDRFACRLRSPTAPLFRLFLFSSPAAATDPASSPRQRYVEAINAGGLPLSPITDPPMMMHHQLSAIPSAGTSPTSADCLFESAAASSGDPCLLGANAGRGGSGGGGGMGMHRVRSTPNLGSGVGNGGSQTSSPRAYKKPGAAYGLKMGGGGGRGFRHEVGYGCGCGCGCACSAPQLMRKYVCSPQMMVEGSPPRRGNQRFHVGPPPFAAPMRKVVWE